MHEFRYNIKIKCIDNKHDFHNIVCVVFAKRKKSKLVIKILYIETPIRTVNFFTTT